MRRIRWNFNGRSAAGVAKSKMVQALEELAEKYGLADNALLQTQIQLYATQEKVVRMIKHELGRSGGTVSKEYVKGRENVYASPMIKELPKHADSMNRTADTIVRIIRELGNKDIEEPDDFDRFLAAK